MTDKDFMEKAISLSQENIKTGGGPFGAIIVNNGKIISEGCNRVTSENDPTSHAEINAIRKAAKSLGTFNLSGCTIYTSCEPCPMCLGAIYWAHLDKVFYGASREDAKEVGFDDDFIYNEIQLQNEKRSIPMENLLQNSAIQTFKSWARQTDKIEY